MRTTTGASVLRELERLKKKGTLDSEAVSRVNDLRDIAGLLDGESEIAKSIMSMCDNMLNGDYSLKVTKGNVGSGNLGNSDSKLSQVHNDSLKESGGMPRGTKLSSDKTNVVTASTPDVDSSSAEEKLTRVHNDSNTDEDLAWKRREDMQDKEYSAIKDESGLDVKDEHDKLIEAGKKDKTNTDGDDSDNDENTDVIGTNANPDPDNDGDDDRPEELKNKSKKTQEAAKDYSIEERKKLAKSGAAKPDGSFPIENSADLVRAIKDWGRAGATSSDKAHIVSRAKTLGLSNELPEEWEGSTKKDDDSKSSKEAHNSYGGYDSPKKSKEDVNYRDSTSKNTRCGMCKFYNVNHSCSIVEGVIEPDDVCDDFKAEVKTNKTALLRESNFVDYVETHISEADSTKEGKEWDVILIQTGVTKNNKYYSSELLKESVSLFEGVSAFADHATDEEFRKRPERSIRDKVGIFKNVEFGTYKVRGKVVEGLKARFKVITPWLRELLKESVNLDEPNFLGFSIDIFGSQEPKTINNKKVSAVKKILHVNSVDCVTSASAGGEILRLVASSSSTNNIIKDNNIMLTKEELAELVKTQVAEVIKEVNTNNKDTVDKVEFTKLQEVVRKQSDEVRVSEAVKAVRGLSDIGKEKVTKELLAIAANRSPDDTEIVNLIKEAVGYESAFAQKYAVPRTMHLNEQIKVGWNSFDRYDLAIQGFFEGKDLSDKNGQKIPRFKGIKEAYCRWSGRDAWEVLPQEIWREFKSRYDSAVDHNKIRESVTLAQWGDIYADNLYIQLMKAYQADADYDRWKIVVSDIQDVPDFQTQHWIRVGGYGDLSSVGEQVTYPLLTSPTDEQVNYSISKRGGLDEVTFEAIVDDRVQAIRRIPGAMGRAAARTLYKAVIGLIVDTNPTMGYDSVALYHATHGNLGSTALSVTGVATAVQGMRAQTAYNESSEILGYRNKPKVLITGNTLEYVAQRILNPSDAYFANTPAATPGTTDSSLDKSYDPQAFKGSMELLVYDQASTTTEYVLVADPNRVPTMVVGFLNGQRDPELFVQDQPTVGSVFTSDQITYKVRHIYGVVVEDHRSFYKGNT